MLNLSGYSCVELSLAVETPRGLEPALDADFDLP